MITMENPFEPTQFAQLLNNYIRILGISEQDLAKAAGVDKSIISRWKSGKTHHPSSKNCHALREIVLVLSAKTKGFRAEAKAKAQIVGCLIIDNLLSDLESELNSLNEQFEKLEEKRKAQQAYELLGEYLTLKRAGFEAEPTCSQKILAAEILELKAYHLYKHYSKAKSQEASQLLAKAFCLKANALDSLDKPSALLKAAGCLEQLPNQNSDVQYNPPTLETEKVYRFEIEEQMTKEQALQFVKQLREMLNDPQITLLKKEAIA